MCSLRQVRDASVRDRLLVFLPPGGFLGEMLFGDTVGGEVRGFKGLAKLHFFAVLEGDALDPFERCILRFDVDQPIAGNQFLGLGKRAVDDLDPAAVEPDAGVS